MHSTPLLDRAGRRRSPATTSTFHQGVAPGNKGFRYPPDPPSVEEIVAVMRSRRWPRGRPAARRDRWAVARRAADQRGALAQRNRPRPERGALLVSSRQRRQTPRGRDGPLGMVTAHTMARAADRSSGWATLLRRSRTDARPAVRPGRDPTAAARDRRFGGCASAVRAASTAPRAVEMSREGMSPIVIQRQLGHYAGSCDHLAICTRNRQHGDHPGRASAARTHDPGRSRTPRPTLISGPLTRKHYGGRGPPRPTTSKGRPTRPNQPALKSPRLWSAGRRRSGGSDPGVEFSVPARVTARVGSKAERRSGSKAI